MSKYKELAKRIESASGITVQGVASFAKEIGGDYETVMSMNKTGQDGSPSGGGAAICVYLMALIAADLEKPE